ncbi:MAG: geranylgeranylglyceryl/heptaprenylglyceryl phosphate synthase [Lentimicrobiaceae bacterium]|jgi:putative glycerol-1-phosphate prenyltransferase|nr:geranylgeranylglyceryl/heptaprenylglyceryl phosphate synthase [Lentimicrobiaceae bacterium]MCP4910420.1 geranylgeranylglyceryl/heptaprenylglyceryl phosphate synthase [Bacteroidota bacterium]MBT3455161.1 geranylgeranylglyceryl/heptaprenylglyceryl phosphate synthase [Lentimicrobiaceae bacterium]MBT3819389.1 geranylgeranylglyceryl/heptaprenylglyceryl phosphate synthase [Lentimicrobiaceae bacterium]MBT4060925.1 geranylgeranylglyceryl/heptaprenylglyceryl phosphate synthase [Lentimicrobiaceae bact
MSVIDIFSQKKKQLAVLIDPDKLSDDKLTDIAIMSNNEGVDIIFVGGSLITSDSLSQCIKIIKENTDIPVILFPGNSYQISRSADGMLFLQLISGRNPDMLIGWHVLAAPYIKLSGIETIPTGYMLIDSGKPTSVSYMSNSMPIPNDKKDIAACTAMAGEMLGLKTIFMDAGSGASITIPENMVEFVKGSIDIPLIIGGGIRTPEKAKSILMAGADIVVVGNIFEENPDLIGQFMNEVHSLNKS